MKKIIMVVFFICLIGTGIYVFNNSNWKKEQPSDIQALFTNWDNGEVEQSEKIKIIEKLMDYVSRHPQVSSEELQALSNHISVFETGDLRMVQYIENPDFFGSSARESYHFVAYNGLSKIIDSKGSMSINKIVNRSDSLYFVYAIDYKMSNITGIQIFSIEINNRKMNQKHIINKEHLVEKFSYDEISNVLYYDNGHIYFKEIGDNGNEVLISAGDNNYTMFLDKDKFYHISLLQ